MKIRVGTFNAENLFARFRFKGEYTDEEIQNLVREGWDVDKTKMIEFEEEDRRITGQAIRETRADVLALCEIESLDTLKRFVASRQLNYKHRLLIDGNDPRLIDVAVLSKFPFAYIRTHQSERTANNRSYVFSRDCLEVGIQVSVDTVLPIFVNHFKSMMGGRGPTMARRQIQSEAVVRILKERFGADPGKADWIVAGDLNDYLPSTGLDPLLSQPWLENVVNRIADPNDRWTHYWDGGNQYTQLDYLLLSRALAKANPDAVPKIVRNGMPRRATRYPGPRFDGVGEDRPKASDHCPLVIGLEL